MQALFDIGKATRITKSFSGVICDDDLEKLPFNPFVNISSRNKDQDYVQVLDSLTQSPMLQPGFLLAISEECKMVKMKDGFWWIHKHETLFASKYI